jgi:hypothetical protein
MVRLPRLTARSCPSLISLKIEELLMTINSRTSLIE